jgi:KipI family sensor histidine kinase inhibitor
MQLLPYGERAALIELPDLAAVLAMDASLRGAAWPDVIDIVPAARTILLRFRRPADLAGLRERLHTLPAATPSTTPRPPMVIPTRYDGPDLASAATGLGRSPQALVAAHTGAVWTVAFCGFAPGFAYLTGDDPELATVPRRPSPRTRVPAGSVALAGGFSAVYPAESPGGWQLIGRTDLVVFSPRRDEPALLEPGTQVRFEAIR